MCGLPTWASEAIGISPCKSLPPSSCRPDSVQAAPGGKLTRNKPAHRPAGVAGPGRRLAIQTGPSQLVNTFVTGGMWALMAVGLALVFGVMNIPQFAHGESFMVGAYVAYFVFMPLTKCLKAHPNASAQRALRLSPACWSPHWSASCWASSSSG